MMRDHTIKVSEAEHNLLLKLRNTVLAKGSDSIVCKCGFSFAGNISYTLGGMASLAAQYIIHLYECLSPKLVCPKCGSNEHITFNYQDLAYCSDCGWTGYLSTLELKRKMIK